MSAFGQEPPEPPEAPTPPDNVIQLRGQARLPLRHGRKTQTPTCFHNHYTVFVDSHARAVECGGCGASLDPIAVLARFARDCEWVRHMRSESDSLKREITAKKDEVRRLNSLLRYRHKKQADPAIVLAPSPPKPKR